MVGDLRAVLGDRERGAGHLGVGDGHGPDLGGVAGAGQSGGVDALGEKDVVHGLVRAVAEREVVGARVDDVGALGAVLVLVGAVPARDVLEVDLHGDLLGGAGLELVGLLEGNEVARGLLDAQLGVELRIRCREVQLRHVLAGHRSRVGHRDARHELVVLLAGRNGVKRLREGRVAEAVPEREDHRVLVGEARVHKSRRLVVAVAHVDALLVLVEGAQDVAAVGEAP